MLSIKVGERAVAVQAEAPPLQHNRVARRRERGDRDDRVVDVSRDVMDSGSATLEPLVVHVRPDERFAEVAESLDLRLLASGDSHLITFMLSSRVLRKGGQSTRLADD